MSDADPGLKTIIFAALEWTDPAERAAYLDRVCGNDTALRHRIEALLAAHDGAGRFLEGNTTDLCRKPGNFAGARCGNASAVSTGARGRKIGPRRLHARRRRAGRPSRPIGPGPGDRRPLHAARSPR
jgi:hypothetical protein